MKYIPLLALLILTSCSSNESKVASAESHQAASLIAEQKAEKAKEARVSSLTRQVQLIADAPITPKSVAVIDQLSGLSLKLTGPTDMSDSDLAKQNLQLLGTIEQNQKQIAAIQKDDNDKSTKLAQSQDEVKAKTAQLYAVASNVAIDLDKTNAWIDKLWWIGIAFAALFVFALLCKLGIVTGVFATQVASKVP